MKNIDKTIKTHIAMAGGKTMKVNGVSDPRFSRVESQIMFPTSAPRKKNDDIEEAKEHKKEGPNPNKGIKPLKKMKGAEKKGKE